MCGYTGKLIDVDLLKGKVLIKELNYSYARAFIGGSGLAAKIIYDEVPGNVNPLSPSNVLVFMTGPLTGTAFPSSGRHIVAAKSPLTNIWGEAAIGGFWGTELKKAGFDGIIIHNRSKKPVYLMIEDGIVEVNDASHIWGKDTLETEEIIRKDLGDDKIKVSCIGKAGENQVRFSAIISDGGRAAGRCGLGAVMGSKNLKAIAVRGTKEIEVCHYEEFKEHCREIMIKIKNSMFAKSAKLYGTAGYMTIGYVFGDIPIKNWKKGTWSGIDKISGETMAKSILKRATGCYNCIILCGRYVKIEEGPYAGVEGHGPEYETCASIGSLCLIDDLKAIAKANDLCTRYGLDTISTGSVIAFAIECYERGLITKEDLNGLELKWGDPKCVIELIERIVEKKGIGKVLSEGVAKASKHISGSNEIAVHVRGLEVPMHDPRAFEGLALQYATMPRGGCHTALAYTIERGLIIPDLGFTREYVENLDRFSPNGKAEIVKKMQDFTTLFDSLAICKFLLFAGVNASDIAKAYSLDTGWETDIEGLLETGERIFNLKRVFNIRCGSTGKEDRLPKRLLTPLANGGAKNHVPSLEPMLKEYYQLRGWTEGGIPTKEKLNELGLNGASKELWSNNLL